MPSDIPISTSEVVRRSTVQQGPCHRAPADLNGQPDHEKTGAPSGQRRANPWELT